MSTYKNKLHLSHKFYDRITTQIIVNINNQYNIITHIRI